jgi:hypothetical protein
VLARKNYLTHKISDIMSFVNNSSNLWDLIELEDDLKMGKIDISQFTSTKEDFPEDSLENLDE